MTPVEINFSPTTLYQSVVLNIEPDGNPLRLEVELRYLEYVDKWFFSVFDMETGDSYCRYLPVVASCNAMVDLLGPIEYKNLGSFFCISNSGDDTVTGPTKDTLGDYTFIWSDRA